jgi:hypothetical protein
MAAAAAPRPFPFRVQNVRRTDEESLAGTPSLPLTRALVPAQPDAAAAPPPPLSVLEWHRDQYWRPRIERVLDDAGADVFVAADAAQQRRALLDELTSSPALAPPIVVTVEESNALFATLLQEASDATKTALNGDRIALLRRFPPTKIPAAVAGLDDQRKHAWQRVFGRVDAREDRARAQLRDDDVLGVGGVGGVVASMRAASAARRALDEALADQRQAQYARGEATVVAENAAAAAAAVDERAAALQAAQRAVAASLQAFRARYTLPREDVLLFSLVSGANGNGDAWKQSLSQMRTDLDGNATARGSEDDNLVRNTRYEALLNGNRTLYLGATVVDERQLFALQAPWPRREYSAELLRDGGVVEQRAPDTVVVEAGMEPQRALVVAQWTLRARRQQRASPLSDDAVRLDGITAGVYSARVAVRIADGGGAGIGTALKPLATVVLQAQCARCGRRFDVDAADTLGKSAACTWSPNDDDLAAIDRAMLASRARGQHWPHTRNRWPLVAALSVRGELEARAGDYVGRHDAVRVEPDVDAAEERATGRLSWGYDYPALWREVRADPTLLPAYSAALAAPGPAPWPVSSFRQLRR